YEDGQLQLNQEAWFASNGPSFVGPVKPDLVAPSIFGRSPNPFHNVWLDVGESSRWWSGTSLACPIAAGATALILEAVRDNLGDANWYDPQILKDIVMSTASDIGVDPFIQGHGLVDIEAAVDYILNGGGYSIQSDSFRNYADVMADAWDYWVPEWAPYGVWHPNYGETGDTPVGLESSSMFFGNVYRSGSYDVNITMVDLNDLATTAVSSDFNDFDPWYYSMAEQFSYIVETRAQNDTNIYNVYRGDVVNLATLLSPAELLSFNNAPYVTINAGFDELDTGIGMRVWDYLDRNVDGVTNYWYNSTYPGDYIQWISRDTNNCNNLIARLSQPQGGTVGDLFTYSPVVHLDDPTADESQGSQVILTFTIWNRVADSSISFADDTSVTTATLSVPADSEYGIHQGSIHVTHSSGYTHEIPYSYMVVFEANGADDEVMTLVDGWGAELTPYESGAWSASFDADASTKMDGGGHRTFVIEIPTGLSALAVRAEWNGPGTVVDMYLRESTYHVVTQTDDGYGPPFNPTTTSSMKNMLIWDPGYEINGTYYLEVSVHVIDGFDAYENITISLQTYSSLGDATVDPSWTSNNSPMPTSFTGGDILTGDHVVIQNVWSVTVPTNLPEYAINSSRISFLSGLFYENTGTLIDPQGMDDWPVPLTGDNFLWETVDGINAGDLVNIELQSISDTSFDVYEWIDFNADDTVQIDELFGSAFISVDDGGDGATEYGSFYAYTDMSIAIRVFAWAWAWNPGDTYTLTVDSRVSYDIDSPTATATHDTYQFGINTTMTVQFTAWNDAGIEYNYHLGEVTFNNYFVPDVTVTSPNGGETWTGTNSILWTCTSHNVDFDPEHEVYVSNDNGQTFMLIANGLTTTSLSWNVSSWQIMDSYMVKVQTLDRGMSGMDISDSAFTAGEIAAPLIAPVITGAASINYVVGDTGNEVSWYVFDMNPNIIQIWIESSLYSEPLWDTPGKTVAVGCDGLSDGTYNYTLYAEDDDGLSSSYTTWVYVDGGEPPSIDHPDDYLYLFGSIGHELTWVVSDVDPADYDIERNGSIIETDTWDGLNISISIDSLPVGVHLYVLTVYDTLGLNASDEVIVTVYTDLTPPVLDHPADITYVLGATGNTIIWHPSDDNPASYVVYRDGIVITSGMWNSTSEYISISVDGLSLGEYDYTIIVQDTGFNTAYDLVTVSVVDSTSTTTETTDTGTTIITLPSGDILIIISFIITIGSIGVIVVIVILIAKSRK
ncbi:MAG: S8 family serine peptidase, partial [Candidatus Thorarchaeota archaeon]